MSDIVYITGFPGPAGSIDYPTLAKFPIDVGVDPEDLNSARGKAYLLRAAPIDQGARVVLKGPPFPAGMIDYPTAFQVEWAGASGQIYLAASKGRATSADDVPPNDHVAGLLLDYPINFSVSLFDNIEPTPKGKGGVGAIILVDPSGRFDYLDKLAWDGAPLDVLRGDPDAKFSTYSVVAKLTTAGILPGLRRKEIRLRDLGWQFETADIHDQIYGGTGGLDGDLTLFGVRKPIGFGPVFNVSPVQINATLGIYQLSCTSILAVDAVRVGGLAWSFDADYSTYDDLAAAVVPAASYSTCLAKGLIRRGSLLTNVLTCDFRGDNDTINGVTYPHTRGQIARRIATGRGDVRFPDSQMDFIAFNKLEQAQPATCNFYWEAGNTKSAALTQVMSGCLGWWRVRLNGLLAFGLIELPAGPPALTLEYPSDVQGDPAPADQYQAPRRATYIGWSFNYAVQDASKLAGLAIDAGLAQLYGLQSRYSGVTDRFQAFVWPTSQTMQIDGGYALENDATIEAQRQQTLMGTRREMWLVKTRCDPFANLIGRIIQINNFPRYAWGTSRKFVCVGMQFATGPSVTLILWG